MENDPSQCFFTGAENHIKAGTGAPFARRKEQHHVLYGNGHVTMTLLLTSGSNHTIDTLPHTGGAGPTKTTTGPTTGGGGDKACNDDMTTNKRQQPYHTSVEHTDPHRRGGANQKDHRPNSTGGEGTRPNKTRRGKQQAKQDNHPLDRQGGIPWGGEGRGGVAALHHIW